jgi:hypothetical protein
MFSIQPLFVFAAFLNPSIRGEWPSGDVTCGQNVYSLSDIKEAVSTGTEHFGNPIGHSEYYLKALNPHAIEGEWMD